MFLFRLHFVHYASISTQFVTCSRSPIVYSSYSCPSFTTGISTLAPTMVHHLITFFFFFTLLKTFLNNLFFKLRSLQLVRPVRADSHPQQYLLARFRGHHRPRLFDTRRAQKIQHLSWLNKKFSIFCKNKMFLFRLQKKKKKQHFQ